MHPLSFFVTMVCQQCLRFIQDYLEFPSKTNPSSSKKLSLHTRTIAHEIYRILHTQNSHHNMVKRVKREYLNLVEKKIHTPAKPLELHLFDVSLNYYNYVLLSNQKKKELDQTIQIICQSIIDYGIVKYHKSKDPTLNAKLWFLEKYFFFLEFLNDIHYEHSEKKPLTMESLVFQKNERITDEEIETWDELYN